MSQTAGRLAAKASVILLERQFEAATSTPPLIGVVHGDGFSNPAMVEVIDDLATAFGVDLARGRKLDDPF